MTLKVGSYDDILGYLEKHHSLTVIIILPFLVSLKIYKYAIYL